MHFVYVTFVTNSSSQRSAAVLQTIKMDGLVSGTNIVLIHKFIDYKNLY